MLFKRNILDILLLCSFSATIFCVILNTIINISPITGIWLATYVFLLFVVSLTFSFKFLHWLLNLNKPIKYDIEGLVNKYPFLSCFAKFLPSRRKLGQYECKEYDTNELSVITTVLERKLVSSWYVPYISQEIGFPFACKQMLDQMIGRTFQICDKIDSKEVYIDICSILVTHLKEYTKALKRHEKCPENTIDSLYKKSHLISNSEKSTSSADHCTNVLRIMLKELVPWEMWDTPHSELLVRILSKKLDNFIQLTLADPDWLNNKLLVLLKCEPVKKDENQGHTEPDLVENIKEESKIVSSEKPCVESVLSTTVNQAPLLQQAVIEESKEETVPYEQPSVIEEMPVATTEPVDIKSSPILRQRRGRQGRNEVKIYDRIIEGSVKTWETDVDLQCISLGQDLLASLDGEITLSRLWGQDAEPEGSPNPPRSKSPQTLWFGEDEAVDLEEGDLSPPKGSIRREPSPKPTDALLKDLQTTVHQAKTKIGDLQVPTCAKIDVPYKQCSGDEAAGMMEGLLDFGIAGLKKGLRLTGLSDDSQEKSPSHKERSVDKISPTEAAKTKPGIPNELKDTSIIVQKEDNGNSIPTLTKQQRVISQDSVPTQAKGIPFREPPPLLPLSDSPEPEYEEAADLSTSIAKLRCLLQRAETSPSKEEVWWESTRHSSRPVDTATLADEYDMSVERGVSPGQTSNNMQRLDKLFQRTVTGVFNSIKTAVGAENQVPGPDLQWAYVPTSMELSVGACVARLVGSGRALGAVDAALDSLNELPPPPTQPLPPEDFEEWCAGGARGWSAGGAALHAARGLRAHLAHRALSALLAELAESLITSWLEDLSSWLRGQVFEVFKQMDSGMEVPSGKDQTLRPMDVEETCSIIMENMPTVLYMFGEETLTNSVRLCVSSVSHREVNRDLSYRLLDILALHFSKAAALRNPSFDAN